MFRSSVFGLSLGLLLCGSPRIALAQSSSEPAPASAASEEWFYDSLGRRLPFEPTYAAWGSERYEPHYLRAGLEMLGVLGAGTAWYWIKAGSNSEDWDFPKLSDRLLTFEAVRFDNNRHITNHVLHPAAGSAYYAFSRVNGLDPYAAIGYSFLSSAFFEWGLEWLEKVSINDLMFTPFGGWAPGEFFFQMGDYLNSAPGGGSWGNRVGMYSLGLPRYVHDRWDDVPPPPPLPPDNLGFSSAYWHRFGVGYGLAGIENEEGNSKLVHDVRLEAELVRMPGFLRPGHFDKLFSAGNFVDMRTRMSFDETGWADADLWFSADITGYYHQDLVRAPGGVRGQAWSGGLNTAARFTDRWLLDRRDGWAIAHLLGPSLRGWFGEGAVMARFSLASHIDFAGVRSLAYPEWVERFGPAGTKTTLQLHTYYFGLGGSARATAAVSYLGTELGTRLGYGHYDSIEGLDREQEEIFRDVHNSDEIVELAGWLSHAASDAPVRVRISGEVTQRWSHMPPIHYVRWDRRIGADVSLYF